MADFFAELTRRFRGGRTIAPMRKLSPSNALAGICFVSLIALQGCATARFEPPPVSTDIRATLGTVGVISVVFSPEASSGTAGASTEPDRLPDGQRSLSDRCFGTSDSLGQFVGDLALMPVCTVIAAGGQLLFPVLLPLLIVEQGFLAPAEPRLVDASPGIIIPYSASQVGQEMLDRTVGAKEPVVDLRERLVSIIAARSTARIVELGTGASISLIATPDYSMLAGTGVDTVLEVGMVSVSLVEEDTRDSYIRFRLLAAVRTRLLRVADNRLLWKQEHAYTTPAYSIPEWAADDDALLVMSYASGLQSLAQQNYEKVFVGTEPN